MLLYSGAPLAIHAPSVGAVNTIHMMLHALVYIRSCLCTCIPGHMRATSADASNTIRMMLYIGLRACTCSCGRGVYAGELAYDLGLRAAPGFGLRCCLYLLHSTNLKVSKLMSAPDTLSITESNAAQNLFACRYLAVGLRCIGCKNAGHAKHKTK